MESKEGWGYRPLGGAAAHPGRREGRRPLVLSGGASSGSVQSIATTQSRGCLKAGDAQIQNATTISKSLLIGLDFLERNDHFLTIAANLNRKQALRFTSDHDHFINLSFFLTDSRFGESLALPIMAIPRSKKMTIFTTRKQRSRAGVKAQIFAFSLSLALATSAAQVAQGAPMAVPQAEAGQASLVTQEAPTGQTSPLVGGVVADPTMSGTSLLDLYPLEGEEVPLADQDAARGGNYFVAVVNGLKYTLYACASRAACHRIIAAVGEGGGKILVNMSDKEYIVRRWICRRTGRLC